MKHLLTAGLLVAAHASIASAQTYVGLGIGTAPSFGESKDRLEGEGRSGKVLLGMRFGKLSAEGSVGRFETLRLNNGTSLVALGDTYQASLAGKLSFPLGNNFEAFGRAGLHRTWVSSDNEMNAVSGSGILVGAGLEYRLNLVAASGSIFIDYQYNSANLTGDRFKFDDVSYRMLTAGITIGL